MEKFGIKPGYVGLGVVLAAVLAIVLLFNSLVGINNSGERQFVQTISGSTKIVFSEGPYGLWLGNNETYKDYLTYDFTGPKGRCEYENGDGLKVQYQDGGWGVVCGQVRVPLPSSSEDMMKIHKQYRSETSFRNKMIDKTTRRIAQLTSGLMTSAEAYSTKRAEFNVMVKDQFNNGAYETETETISMTISVDEKGVEETQERDVAIIKVVEGVTKYNENPLDSLNIVGVEVDITNFDFEQKTIDQIGARRDAQNRTITAKDEAKAAFFEKKKAIAEGEKNVAVAEARENVIAQKQIVAAERDKTLALIKAELKTAEALEMTAAAKEQTKREAELAKAAKHTAARTVTLAKAEAYKRKSAIEADNGFKLQLANDLARTEAISRGISNMKMPEVMIIGGGSGGASDSELKQLLQFQVVESARKLAKQTSNTGR